MLIIDPKKVIRIKTKVKCWNQDYNTWEYINRIWNFFPNQQSYMEEYRIREGYIVYENSEEIYPERWGGVAQYIFRFIDLYYMVDFVNNES